MSKRATITVPSDFGDTIIPIPHITRILKPTDLDIDSRKDDSDVL